MEPTIHTRTLTLARFRLLSTACAGLALAGQAAASNEIFSDANTTVTMGHAYGDLEHNNPITAGDKAPFYPMLEWRDAGTGGGGFEDWTVSGSGVSGYANEIWLRNSTHSASTTTTVPSTKVSVHLHGDSNDGVASIYVDGVLRATVDMYDSGVEEVMVLVEGLPETTHTIEVQDDGDSPSAPGTQDDIAIMGAAALGTILVSAPAYEFSIMQLELGLDEFCNEVCPTPAIQISYWDRLAAATDVGFAFVNIGPTLVDLGVGCIPFGSASLCLNPTDPAFSAGFLFGFAFFGTDADGDPVWHSNTLPVAGGCGLIGQQLKLQAFRYGTAQANVESSSEIYKIDLVPCQ